MALKIVKLVLGPLQTNTYVISNGAACAVVDPASGSGRLLEAIDAAGGKLEYVLLTHGHFDHTGGIGAVKAAHPGVRIVINGDDADMLADPGLIFPGAFFGARRGAKADLMPADGEILDLGGDPVKVIFTPGHSRGSCCYQIGDAVFCGDTAFRHGCGRTDFYGGDASSLEASLRKLAGLPDDTALYPGHGPQTTVGEEKKDGGCMKW